jgi:hypothetical protein
MTSLFTAGSYAFPNGFYMTKRTLDQKDDPMEILGLAGTHAPASIPSAATIECQGAIGVGEAGSAVSLISNYTDMSTELDAMYSALQPNSGAYISFQAGGMPTLPRAINGYVKNFEVDTSEVGRKFAEVKFSIVCPDPRWLSVSGHNATAASGNLSNAGNAPSFPVFNFSGPGTGGVGVTVYPGLSSAFGNSIQVALSYVLATSDSLIINCDPRQRQLAIDLNGIGRLDLLGTTGLINEIGNNYWFPYLSTGNNFYTITGYPTSFSVTWFDAWWI